MERCAECGFEYDDAHLPTISATIRALAAEHAEIQTTADPAALRRRREPATWSALEYGCHLRDVLLVQRERLLAARRTDTPVAEPMGRDERAEHDGYADQAPIDIARQLTDAAALLTHAYDRLGPADRERRLVYTYPERAERSLGWLALHTAHELRHHLLDVERQGFGRSKRLAKRWHGASTSA
ncbi:DinB family protein [Nocardia jiangsuensis]|uniref:DinB family protein n=1 Tax=Nocardia jiangsuensis TaxID=1691563 RepID=A0ABV8DU87_9NOCA